MSIFYISHYLSDDKILLKFINDNITFSKDEIKLESEKNKGELKITY